MIFANLDGEKSNFTLSDDDEAFQECQSSLTDLSGTKNHEDDTNQEDDKNSTLEADTNSPNSSNKTLVLDKNETFDSPVNDKTFEQENHVEVVNKSLGSGKDSTFDVSNILNGTSEPPSELCKKEGKEIEDGIEINIESEKELQRPDLEEIPSTEPVDGPKKDETNLTVKYSENRDDVETCVDQIAENSLPLPEELNVNEIKINFTNVSTEAAETALPESPAPETIDYDVSMEDISAERQTVVSSFPTPADISIKTENEDIAVEAAEITYRNIDESGKHDKTQIILEENEDQVVESTIAQVFKEKLKKSFEVQFKMPAAPLLKPSEIHSAPIPDSEFGCASSCKTNKPFKTNIERFIVFSKVLLHLTWLYNLTFTFLFSLRWKIHRILMFCNSMKFYEVAFVWVVLSFNSSKEKKILRRHFLKLISLLRSWGFSDKKKLFAIKCDFVKVL